MSNENQNIELLKKQKTEVSSEIKALEEKPKAKMNPIWMTLIYIITISSAAIILAKPALFYIPLILFVITLSLGIGNRIVVGKKNRAVEAKLLKLKAEEMRLVSQITAERNKSSAEKSEEAEQAQE